MKIKWGLFLLFILSTSQGFSAMMPPSGLSKFSFYQQASMMDLQVHADKVEYSSSFNGVSAKVFVTIVNYRGPQRVFESFIRFTAEEASSTQQGAHDRLKERLIQNMSDYFGARCMNAPLEVRVYETNFTVEYANAGSRMRGSPLGSLIGLRSDCHLEGERKAEELLSRF